MNEMAGFAASTGSRQRDQPEMKTNSLENLSVAANDETFIFADLDPRISYPSYVSMDSFVDVQRIRSLDGYIRQRIKRHILEHQDEHAFYTGPYRLNGAGSEHPGSRMIYLSQSDRPDSYFDLDRADLWHRSGAADEFSLLMDLISTFPFKTTGRMLIIYDDHHNDIPAHRDHVDAGVLHDFIWFRTNLDKPLYMLSFQTGERQYVEGYSAWFDTVNQFHGIDGVDGLSFSVRIDGTFTDEFRSQIPRPQLNAASTPSLWASVGSVEGAK
jgi:hypothetical protein